ncbi:MAG TPA: sigma-70 family RNA polymerase sigma factor [Gemmataceae bacterium]|jgi:RNA polymerase sigma factor (sigma-70 family)
MTQRNNLLLHHIRLIATQGMGEQQTDGQLLEHFISKRDEAAFTLLVRRHGSMVWSVCRRVVGNAQDADDAFQAAFLVLVRKANSIRPREAVGNWLYGVAYRTALEARSRLVRRRAKEQPLSDVLPESKPDEPCRELWPILDRELSRLAGKYRLPIVLCDLEGRSRREVARQLAIPEGTLSSRLATARKQLALRLARYGFAISVTSLGALLTEKTATASLSLTLLSSTTKAALVAALGPTASAGSVSATVSTLTEGVLKAMFIAKVKTATLVLCGVVALSVGTSGVYYQTRAGAADSPEADRVVQDNHKSTSDSGDREIDRLKRENELLRTKVKHEQDRAAGYREKLITFVNNHANTIFQAEAATKTDRKPGSNPTLEEKEAMQDDLKKRYQEQFAALRAKLQQMDVEREKLQAERQAVEAKQAVVERARVQLDTELKKLQVEFQRQVENLADIEVRIKREQAGNPQRLYPPARKLDGDKLDQILQRLEHLEKRLDRLESVRK